MAYFERKLKELEEQRPQSLKEVPKALKDRKGFKQENSKQTSISSFFKKEIKEEPIDSPIQEERVNIKSEQMDLEESTPKDIASNHVKEESVTPESSSSDRELELQPDSIIGERKFKLMSNGDGSYDTHRRKRVSHETQPKEKESIKTKSSMQHLFGSFKSESEESNQSLNCFKTARQMLEENNAKLKGVPEKLPIKDGEKGVLENRADSIGFTSAREMLERSKQREGDDKSSNKLEKLGFISAREMLEKTNLTKDVWTKKTLRKRN